MKVLNLLAAVVTLLLVSCSSGIVMKSYWPSQAGLLRGEPLVVTSERNNETSNKLVNGIKKKLEQQNYYRIGVNDGNILYLHNIDVDINTSYYRDGNYKAYVTLSGDATFVSNGNVVFSRHYSFSDNGIIYRDSRDQCEWLIKYNDFIYDVVYDVVPYSYEYTVEIHPAKGNSMLEHAAECCAEGNWEQGRFLAENSLTVFPNDPEGYYLLGMIARQERNFDEARAQFRKAAEFSYAERYNKAIADTDRIEQNEALVRKQMNGAPMPK